MEGPLFELLLLVVLVVVVVKLVNRDDAFLSKFAALLTDSRIQRGTFSFISGRSYLGGKFRNRDVAVRLQLKRGRYSLGYLVVAVRTGVPLTLRDNGIIGRTGDEAGQRALHALAAHDFFPSIEEGWLKVMWRPVGFFIFPGRFSAEKWQQVLEALHALATSLDSAAKGLSAEVS